ncbi:MAG: NADPH-dependent FMN reductase [Candidatus Taylorbacteria bacterium]
MYIPILLGTARKGRFSEKVAHYILPRIQKRKDIETELIDVRDHLFGRTIPSWEDDPKVTRWREIAKRAEGFIIVSPEYNHGFPGELKIILDSAYGEYKRKPVAVAAVSNGIFGGARMVELLIHVFRKLGLVVSLNTLYFGNVEELFDKKGNILDKKYDERVEKFIDDLVWHVKTLNYGREKF